MIEHLNVGFFGSPPDFPGLPWEAVLGALGQTGGAAVLAKHSAPAVQGDTSPLHRPLLGASPRTAGWMAHGEHPPSLALPQQMLSHPTASFAGHRRHNSGAAALDDLGADESTQQMLRLEAELTHAEHAITGAELSQRRVEKTGSVGHGGGRAGGVHAAGGTGEGEFGQKRTSEVALRLRSAILRRLAPSPGQQLHEGQGREWLKLSALWDCDSLIHETLTQRRRLRTAPMPKSERVVLADVLSFAWLEDDPVLVNTLLKNGLLEDPHPFHLLSRHVCDALDRTTTALTAARDTGETRVGVWGGGSDRRFVLPTAHASTRLVTERLLQWYTAFTRYFDSRTASMGETHGAQQHSTAAAAAADTSPSAHTAAPIQPQSPRAAAAAAADPVAIRRASASTRGLFSPHGGGSSRRLGGAPQADASPRPDQTAQNTSASSGDDAVFRSATEVFQKPRWLAECQEALRVLRITWAAINGKFRVARALLSHTTQPLRTALLVALVLRKLADQGQLSNTSVLNDVDELLEQAEVFESLAIRLLTAVHDESVSIHWTEAEKAQAALWILTPAGPAWAVVDAALAVLLAPYSTSITRTFMFHAVDPLVAPDVLGWALGGAALGTSTTKDILRLAVRGGCRRFLALDVVQSLVSNVWNSGTWLRGEAQAALVAAGHGSTGGRWLGNTSSALAVQHAPTSTAVAQYTASGGTAAAGSSTSPTGAAGARSSRSVGSAGAGQASSSSLLAVRRALRAQGGVGGSQRGPTPISAHDSVTNPLQPHTAAHSSSMGAPADTASRSVGHASLVAVRAAVRLQRLQRLARMATAQKALQSAQRARSRVATMRSRGGTLDALEANLATIETSSAAGAPPRPSSPQRWSSGPISPGRMGDTEAPLAAMPLETFIAEFRLQPISRHLARLGVQETIDLFVLVEDDRVAGNLSRIHWSRLGAAVSALKSVETLEGRAWRLMNSQRARHRGRGGDLAARGRRVSSAGGGYASSDSEGSEDSAFGGDVDSVVSQEDSGEDSDTSSLARSTSLQAASLAGSALGSVAMDNAAGDRRPGYVLTMDVFRQSKVKAHLQRLQSAAGAAGSGDGGGGGELMSVSAPSAGGVGSSADAFLEGSIGWEGGAQGGHALMTDVNALSTNSGISLTSAAREAALYVLPLTDVRRCAVTGVAYASPQARLLHVAPSWGPEGGAPAPRWALHSAGLLTQSGDGAFASGGAQPVARFVIKTVPSWWAAVQQYLSTAWAAAAGGGEAAITARRSTTGVHGSAIGSSSSGRLAAASGRSQEFAAQFLVTELAAWTRLLLWAQQRRAELQFEARRKRLQRSLFAVRTAARMVAAGEKPAGAADGAAAGISPKKAPPLGQGAGAVGPSGSRSHALGQSGAVPFEDDSMTVVADAYSSGGNALRNFDELMDVLPHTLTRVYSLITAPVREVPSMDELGASARPSAVARAGTSRRDLLVATGAAAASNGELISVSADGVHVAGGRLSVRVVGLLMKFHPLGDLQRMFQCMRVARAAVSAQLAGTSAEGGVRPLLQRRGGRSGSVEWGDLGSADLTLAGRGVLQSLHAARVTRSPATAAMSVLYWALWGLGDVLRVAWQVADALATLHSAGIIHNDVGAHNVLLRAMPHNVLDTEGATTTTTTATATATGDDTASEGASDTAEGSWQRPYLHASLTDLGWAVLVRPTQGATFDGTALRRKRRSMRKRAGGESASAAGAGQRSSGAAGGEARSAELDVVTLPAFRPVNVKWCAPETLGSNAEVSRASDVYSFGVLLFELVTGGGAPWRGDSDDMVRLNVREGMTLEGALPGGVPGGLRALMRDCWALDARERPTMEAVKGRLAALWGEHRALEERMGGSAQWTALVEPEEQGGPAASAGGGDVDSDDTAATPPRHAAQPSTDSVTGLDLNSSGSDDGDASTVGAEDAADGLPLGDVAGVELGETTGTDVAEPEGEVHTPDKATLSLHTQDELQPEPDSASLATGAGAAAAATPAQRATAFAGEVWARLYAESVDTLAAEMLTSHSLVPGALRSTALPDVHGRVAASRLRSRAGGEPGARGTASSGSGSLGRSTYRIFGQDSDSDDSDDGRLPEQGTLALVGSVDRRDTAASTYGSRTTQLFAPAVKHAMYGWSELCFVLLHSAVLLTTEPRFADRDACCATDGALRSVVTCPAGAVALRAAANAASEVEHDLTFHASLALKLLLFWWCLSAALSDFVGGGAARFRLLISKFNILKYTLMALAAVSQTIAWLSSAAGNECLGYVTDISTYTLLIVVAFVAYPLLLEYLSTGSYLGPRVFTIANGAAYSMVDVFVFLLLFGLVVSSFVVPLISLFVVSPFGQNSLGEITELLWSVFGDWELPVDFKADPNNADQGPLTTLGVALMAAYLVAALIILLNILIAVLADSYQTARDTSRGAWNVYRIEMLWRYMHRSPIPPPCYFPLMTWAAMCRREAAVCCLRACPRACAACCLPSRLLHGMSQRDAGLMHAVHHRGVLHGVSCMCCGRRCGDASPHTLQQQHGTAQQAMVDRSVTGRILWALRRCGLGCSVQRRVHDMLSPTDPSGLAGMPPTPPGLAATARVAGVRVFGTNKI